MDAGAVPPRCFTGFTAGNAAINVAWQKLPRQLSSGRFPAAWICKPVPVMAALGSRWLLQEAAPGPRVTEGPASAYNAALVRLSHRSVRNRLAAGRLGA